MARVNYGGGIANFRGSIGGNTFHNSPAGSICRTRAARKPTSTPAMSIVHADTYELTRQWREMTFNTQQQWNAFAAAHNRVDPWGKSTVLSGANWFTSVNSNRQLCGSAITSSPPTYTQPTPPDAQFTAARNEGITITYELHATPSDTKLVIQSTPPILGTTMAFRSQLRFTAIIVPLVDDEYDFTDEWEATFGLNMPPSTPASFHVGTMIYTVHTLSGITSPGIPFLSTWYPT